MTGLQDCILVVDDEFLVAQGIAILLEDMGRVVCGIASSADEAVEMAVRHRPKLVLMDVRLPGVADGVDAAIEIQTRVGSLVIFVTTPDDPATLQRINQTPHATLLAKPVVGSRLAIAIQRALAHS